MIVTVTPNPSIDRTVTLAAPLARGAVQRVTSAISEPGGKGVNVARALVLAGVDAVAILPAGDDDPMIAALRASGVTFRGVPVGGAVRTNVAITEPDGTTTKLNEPGATLDAAARAALTRSVLAAAADAAWVVLSGSLPPGLPDDWYAEVASSLRASACKVAIDTSERPLAALAASFGTAAPDVIKPNAEELAGLVGADPLHLESAAAAGDPEPVVSAAREVIARGRAPCSSPSGPRGRYWSTRRGAGWPPRRRSSRAAPSAPATARWPVTCAPKSVGRSRHSAFEWRWPTAAQLPRYPGRRCRHRTRSTSMPFGCMRLRPRPPVLSPSKAP